MPSNTYHHIPQFSEFAVEDVQPSGSTGATSLSAAVCLYVPPDLLKKPFTDMLAAVFLVCDLTFLRIGAFSVVNSQYGKAGAL